MKSTINNKYIRTRLREALEALHAIDDDTAYAEVVGAIYDAIDNFRVYESARRLRSQRQHNGSARALADLQIDADGRVVEISAADLAEVQFAPAHEPLSTPADLEALVQKHFRAIPVAREVTDL
jgi:hypothetical protein